MAELNEKYSQKDAKFNAIITLGVADGEDYSYLSEQPIFKTFCSGQARTNTIPRNHKANHWEKMQSVLSASRRKSEVYGFAIPWTFHTFDKPGFIAGGFKVNESWKNTPVCFDCATRLEIGKKYIEEQLDFGFYGFRYLLVPKLALGGDKKDILKEVWISGQKGSEEEI